MPADSAVFLTDASQAPSLSMNERGVRLPAEMTSASAGSSRIISEESPRLVMGAEQQDAPIADHQSVADTASGFDSDGSASHQDGQNEPLVPSSLGDDILAGLARQSYVTSSSGMAPSAGRLGQFINDVVEQILTADEVLRGQPEVRLVLKESILPATEIILARDGATLTVQFLTRSEDSAQWLSANQRVLQDELCRCLSCPVSVNTSADQQDGRSRGRHDNYPDPED